MRLMIECTVPKFTVSHLTLVIFIYGNAFFSLLHQKEKLEALFAVIICMSTLNKAALNISAIYKPFTPTRTSAGHSTHHNPE